MLSRVEATDDGWIVASGAGDQDAVDGGGWGAGTCKCVSVGIGHHVDVVVEPGNHPSGGSRVHNSLDNLGPALYYWDHQ